MIPEVSMGSFVGLACSETALGQCFHFCFRVVEIVETFETKLETWCCHSAGIHVLDACLCSISLDSFNTKITTPYSFT